MPKNVFCLYRLHQGAVAKATELRIFSVRTFICVIYGITMQSVQLLISCSRGVARGCKGGRMPLAPKSPNNVASTFFSTAHLLPKDFRFKHGGAKLVSCRGRHLTLVRPWLFGM